MIVGLCLLAFATQGIGTAQVPVDGQPRKPQNKPRKQSVPLAKTASPVAVPKPATVVVTPKPSALFRNVGLTVEKRVDDLFSQLKPSEKAQFLCFHQAAIERLGISKYDWLGQSTYDGFPQSIGIAASFDLDLASRVAKTRSRSQVARNLAQFVPIEVTLDPRWGHAGLTFGEDPLLISQMAFEEASSYRSEHILSVVGIVSNAPTPAMSLTNLAAAEGGIRGNLEGGLVLDGSLVGAPATLTSVVAVARKEWGFTGPIISKEDDVDAKRVIDEVLAGVDLFSDTDCKALEAASTNNPEVAKAIDRAVRTVISSGIQVGLFDAKDEKNTLSHTAEEASQLQQRAARESMVLLQNNRDLLPLKKDIKTIAVIGPLADSAPGLIDADETPPADIETPLAAIKKAAGSKTTVLYSKGTGLLARDDLQTIPAAVLYNGLSESYFDSSDLTGTPTMGKESQLDLHWKGPPAEGIASPKFSGSWKGVINPDIPGQYGIGLTVEGGARLYIDDVLVIDEWKDGPLRTKTVPFTFEEKQFYVVRVEYLHGKDPGALRLVWSPPAKEAFRDAVETAIKSDVVIMFLGLGPSLEGGARLRSSLNLPDSQQQLLSQILEIHRPTVVVLLNGPPVSSPQMKREAQAIIEAWHPGEAGGSAIADLLFGQFSPSAKMPVTAYQAEDQLPPEETLEAPRGYRYSLYRPLFSFGSGLSYTKFAYSDLIAPTSFDPSKPVKVSVTVKNIGKRDGDEVVELYLSHESPSAPMPRIALKGFRRIHLGAGESRRMTFEISSKDLAVLHKDGTWWVEPERLQISVGGNQPLDDQPKTETMHLRSSSPKPFAIGA
jgi:beta-glucosidase